jgi:hypothetical protein
MYCYTAIAILKERNKLAITGRDLVAVIQGTLESTSRRDQQDIRERMAKKVTEKLSRFDLELRAIEVFDLIRKNEVKYGTSSTSSKDREEGVTRDLMSWGISNFSEALDLADKLHVDYKIFRTEFLNTRSITAHVGAVLRPFKRRYLEGWTEAGVNNFDLESTEAEVERLSSMVITNGEELRAWSKLVYRLFLDVAVIRDNLYRTNSQTAQKPRKPMGMISAGSERTYNQQWTTWIDDNIESLLGISSSFGSFDVPSGFMQSAGFSQQDRELVYAQYASSASQIQFASQSQLAPLAGTSVLIRVTDSTDSSLTAERTWPDRRTAVGDVANWIKNLIVFWGDGRSVSIHLALVLSTGESKFTLPTTGLSASSDRIISVLNSDL